jgi:HPt (histidine-containing phosphotransfer) domain-containing protein
MMEELFAKFFPQFVALARTRVGVATEAATGRDHTAVPAIVRELHALAGEAGLLGLRQVIPLARDCEVKAKSLQGSRSEADAHALLGALRELSQLIERLGSQ